MEKDFKIYIAGYKGFIRENFVMTLQNQIEW